MKNIRQIAMHAQDASRHIGLLSPDARKEILQKIADFLDESKQEILSANEKDIRIAKNKNMPSGMIDRLLLTDDRLTSHIADVRKIASLNDSIGQTLESRQLPNGLSLRRVCVPIGVIGMIYEARPNVTMDAVALCLKSGNAVVLKGGSDAQFTNRAIVKVIHAALEEIGGLAPKNHLSDAVGFIDTSDRRATQEMITLRGLIDVIIPRGGKGLIDFVRENSTVPVIETGASVVHTYIHADADIKKAVAIVLNEKLRRISVCNTLDTLLIDQAIAGKFLKEFIAALPANSYNATHLELRADSASFTLLKKIPFPKTKSFTLKISAAKKNDFDTEFLDYILSIKIVKDTSAAIDHIAQHSLKHSESIITENAGVAERFLNTVDAACVYWNASTQFSDGGQFGLGAEIGISTQKLHVRGPFALDGLTSYKWIIEGTGQIRP